VLILFGKTKNLFDKFQTGNVAISHANSNRNKPIKQAVCDRGYVGAKVVLGANINPAPQKTLGILQKISPVFAKTKK
jgi:hypothetical protein